MREIGGYIEFETFNGHALHEELTGLNSGRSCLAYLIETKRIRAVALPYFLCDSVKELCEKKGLRIRYYRTGMDFKPEITALLQNEWLYVVNYYGQLTSADLADLKNRYGRVIIDNAQAYFEEPLQNTDTIYTCRKYFGVSDGAFLATDEKLTRELPEDRSADRLGFLFGRFEGRASDYYGQYAANNARFANEPVKSISRLTLNFLRAIDYGTVKQRRTENFDYFHQRLKSVNLLNLRVPEGAFAYPLMLKNAETIRKKMIDRKIYVPLLWPNVLSETSAETTDYALAASVLPLPCDQRYGKEECGYICTSLEEAMAEI